MKLFNLIESLEIMRLGRPELNQWDVKFKGEVKLQPEVVITKLFDSMVLQEKVSTREIIVNLENYEVN